MIDFISSVDWSFLEGLFGQHGKVITAVLGFVIAVVSLLVAFVRHRHAQTLERILGRSADQAMKEQQFVKQGRAALELAQEALNLQEEEIAEREKRLNDVRTGFRGKEYDLWCLHAAATGQHD
ncbi:MAG: hypothetical protein QOF32_2593, partial [Gammaproteobacteria bacterium]|nr:hypothetical protein [Gammaproteobacteria bacterium]